MLQEAGLLGFVLSISLFRYASAQAGAFSANLQQPAQKQPPQQPHRLSVPSPRKYLAQHHFQSAEIYNTFDGVSSRAYHRRNTSSSGCPDTITGILVRRVQGWQGYAILLS